MGYFDKDKDKENRYCEYLDEVLEPENLDYLTVECSTRSKRKVSEAQLLIGAGRYAAALKLADQTAYYVGLNEFV